MLIEHQRRPNSNVSHVGCRKASSNRVIIPLSRRREYIPHSDKHCRDCRTNDKAVETEGFDPAKRREEHHIVGHLGILTYELRPEEIVHQANDEETIREHSRRGGFPANMVSEVVNEFGVQTAELAA